MPPPASSLQIASPPVKVPMPPNLPSVYPAPAPVPGVYSLPQYQQVKEGMTHEEEIKRIVNSEERPWKDISEDLLQSISNLSLSDRIRFRLACKEWKTKKLPPRSIPLHIELTFESQESPWLMFYHSNSTGACNYFHPICNDSYVTPISELAGATICHSKYGWLLMYRNRSCGDCDSLFFFHPLKKAIINLPELPHSFEFTGASFSFPPTSPNCVVFGIMRWGKEDSEILFCAHGHDSWHVKCYDNNVPFIASSCNPVFYDGVFYCLGEDGKLGVFNPLEDTWKVIPTLRVPKMPIYMSFLVECDGDLISVFFGKMGTPASVLKLNWDGMKWVKLQHLGNRMLFVSRTTSLLVQAVTKGTENKIYLPRFGEEGNVFYSLHTNKYQVFDSEYLGENWYNTFEYMNCTWIDLNGKWIDYNKKPYSDEELDWLSNAPEDDSEDLENV